MPRVKTVVKKDEILQAASRVFAEKEFHQVLIDDVAALAGVGKGTVYRYFRTKEELYFETILRALDDLYARLVRTSSKEVSATRRLERIARETLQFSWQRRHLFSLLQSDERRFAMREGELRQRREDIIALFRKAIVDGIESREFRGIDPRIAAELFRGMIRAANCFRSEDDSLDYLVAQIIGTFTRGIASQSA
ncbi:MAG TPA: TetR/AcrR family transcriptional regulator [Thermoanaerobaculia bacterium]|nr:TetR/AcrR family transcriptional regulator [Thermoanaerobaculia bacterium]HSP95445.1 TetR/AcrR family transcriptional regulator [Thermoanaerobaculia bacterium]